MSNFYRHDVLPVTQPTLNRYCPKAYEDGVEYEVKSYFNQPNQQCQCQSHESRQHKAQTTTKVSQYFPKVLFQNSSEGRKPRFNCQLIINGGCTSCWCCCCSHRYIVQGHCDITPNKLQQFWSLLFHVLWGSPPLPKKVPEILNDGFQIIRGQRSRSANQRREYKCGPIKDVYIVFGVDL